MSWLAIWAVGVALPLFAAALIADRPTPWRKVCAAIVCAVLWPLLIPLALIAACGIGVELIREKRA